MQKSKICKYVKEDDTVKTTNRWISEREIEINEWTDSKRRRKNRILL